ncbi:YceD family protein [Xanthobacter oligotrophicus]|uniref:YceD family protein n=1 Tax=Xanthobacter oligotrophicus TaxID=2607286 RepID=UPI0011F1780D|nr:DUF177 domain-containing protein [Xanthobacter oligotrophicus]MCG5233663.1 DUF177 domain-containing protein [Xanthobacter oligotrophicus]
MTDLPYSHPFSVLDLPPGGFDLALTPDAATCAAIARLAGVLAVEDVRATLHLAPEGGAGAHVTGRVTATIRQTCGVTLEPFDAPLSEEIDVHFVPPGTYKPPVAEEENEIDPPDEIVDGHIDAGALVYEFLILGIDPYPRKPGVVFEPPAEDAAASPFAALSRLKGSE